MIGNTDIVNANDLRETIEVDVSRRYFALTAGFHTRINCTRSMTYQEVWEASQMIGSSVFELIKPKLIEVTRNSKCKVELSKNPKPDSLKNYAAKWHMSL